MGNGEWGMGKNIPLPTPHSPFPTPSSIGVSCRFFVRSCRRLVFEEQEEQGKNSPCEDGRLCPQRLPFDGLQPGAAKFSLLRFKLFYLRFQCRAVNSASG